MPKKQKPELSLNPCALKAPDRGGRSSRLGMAFNLFVMVWAPVFALFKFLALIGFVVGAGTIFLGTIGGVGFVVLVGWFIINLVSDGSFWGDDNYRKWRADGGDPYFDWTWFWPFNNDPDSLRYGTEPTYICPNCKHVRPQRRGSYCPQCKTNMMNFLTCNTCGTVGFDPGRNYSKPCGLRCSGCRLVMRTPTLAHLPVIESETPA